MAGKYGKSDRGNPEHRAAMGQESGRQGETLFPPGLSRALSLPRAIGSRTVPRGHLLIDPRSSSLDSRYPILELGSLVPRPRSVIPDPRTSIIALRSRRFDHRASILDPPRSSASSSILGPPSPQSCGRSTITNDSKVMGRKIEWWGLDGEEEEDDEASCLYHGGGAVRNLISNQSL